LILQAEQQEIELHQARLKAIKELSGTCLWQELEAKLEQEIEV